MGPAESLILKLEIGRSRVQFVRSSKLWLCKYQLCSTRSFLLALNQEIEGSSWRHVVVEALRLPDAGRDEHGQSSVVVGKVSTRSMNATRKIVIMNDLKRCMSLFSLYFSGTVDLDDEIGLRGS